MTKHPPKQNLVLTGLLCFPKRGNINLYLWPVFQKTNPRNVQWFDQSSNLHHTSKKLVKEPYLSGLCPRLIHTCPVSAQLLHVRSGTIIVRLAAPYSVVIRGTPTTVENVLHWNMCEERHVFRYVCPSVHMGRGTTLTRWSSPPPPSWVWSGWTEKRRRMESSILTRWPCPLPSLS